MEGFIAIVAIFIALPWLILHYVTKWKTSGGITNEDEVLLEELYGLAKRLDQRMDTVERLVSHDHADFQPARLVQDNTEDRDALRDIEARISQSRAQNKDASR